VGKLDRAKVLEIRQLKARGWSLRMLAKSFKVSRSTIRAVVRLKTWAHVSDLI